MDFHMLHPCNAAPSAHCRTQSDMTFRRQPPEYAQVIIVIVIVIAEQGSDKEFLNRDNCGTFRTHLR